MENNNPWVGLRAYNEDEILYGRDKDILELSMYVMSETELVLYGKSGTGKTSIINAGIIPAAKRNGYIPVLIRLEHNINSPKYIAQIRAAIKREGVVIKPVDTSHSEGKSLLWGFFHGNQFYNSKGELVKLLIIFDQFEEIFTLQESVRVCEDFFKELADLLNNIQPRELSDNVVPEETVSIEKDKELSNDDILAEIGSMEVEVSRGSSSYLPNINVHFLFSLREDYLSELEYYTKKIPALKKHRYAFRPIDEKQAMDIIVKPRKGLVSDDVARKIIAKVCAKDDDSPVAGGMDSAILSLFLSQLYQRLPENATCISEDMLDKFGNDIIKDFYISAVSDITRIRPEAVKKIEDCLLTKDNNHRDNKDLGEILDKYDGLTEAELDYLENDKRILSRFKRAKAIRIEFVHDIIATVAAQHKKIRETEDKARAEKIKMAKQNRRNLWIFLACSVSSIILAVYGMSVYMSESQGVISPKQSFIVTFVEDSLTTENEYWKGQFSVIGHRKNRPDTILFDGVIDKGLKDSVFKFEIDTLRSLSFAMNFPGYSKYQNVQLEKGYGDIMKSLNVKIQLRKKNAEVYPYFGNVSVENNGVRWPVQDALVCLQDITTRTDSSGNFKYYLDKEISPEDDIFIIKKGLSLNDYRAKDNERNNIHYFVVYPRDSIQTLQAKIARIDSLTASPNALKYIINNQTVYNQNGSTDILNLRGIQLREAGDKCLIEGYFYFHSDRKKDRSDGKLFSYYLFTGEIGRKWTDGYKSYSVEGFNIVGNKINITGTLKQSSGTWTGEITSPVGLHATFPR